MGLRGGAGGGAKGDESTPYDGVLAFHRMQLSQAIVTAKKTTASAGVFQKELVSCTRCAHKRGSRWDMCLHLLQNKETPQKLAGKKRKVRNSVCVCGEPLLEVVPCCVDHCVWPCCSLSQ